MHVTASAGVVATADSWSPLFSRCSRWGELNVQEAKGKKSTLGREVEKNYSIVGNEQRERRATDRPAEAQQEEEELKEKKKSEADGWIDRMRNGRGFAWMHMRKVAACALALLGRVFGSEKTAARDLCTRR